MEQNIPSRKCRVFAPKFSVIVELMKPSLVAVSLIAMTCLSSCASAPSSRNSSDSGTTLKSEKDRASAETNRGEAAAVSALPRIKAESNPAVEKWIDYFSKKDRERFHRFLQRGSSYREVVENTLDESGLPRELYYLAMIESGYQTRATSRASAVGVWQFISATGKRYGLELDDYVDERRDPIRATEAAAKYLRDLYNVFGSWPLALAAYNSGETRVMNAIIRGKSRDYWELRDRGVLPRETSEYYPKFLAAVAIGEDPDKFGFSDIQFPKYPTLESVEVPGGLRLNDIASVSGVGMDDLARVNPHLKKRITPGYGSEYEIWVPEELASRVTAVKGDLARYTLAPPTRRMLALNARKRASRHFYIVRFGDSLTSIARRHSMSVGYLKKINRLRGNVIYPGRKLRVVTATYKPRRRSIP